MLKSRTSSTPRKYNLLPFKVLAYLVCATDKSIQLDREGNLYVRLTPFSVLTNTPSHHLRKSLFWLKDRGFLSYLEVGYGEAELKVFQPQRQAKVEDDI